MATGDIGGPVTELIISCQAKEPMKLGDAVALVGNYTVGHRPFSTPFGQCMQDSSGFLESVMIKIRGVAVFRMSSDFEPNLRVPCLGNVKGDGLGNVNYQPIPIVENRILKLDHIKREVHVLL